MYILQPIPQLPKKPTKNQLERVLKAKEANNKLVELHNNKSTGYSLSNQMAQVNGIEEAEHPRDVGLRQAIEDQVQQLITSDNKGIV